MSEILKDLPRKIKLLETTDKNGYIKWNDWRHYNSQYTIWYINFNSEKNIHYLILNHDMFGYVSADKFKFNLILGELEYIMPKENQQLRYHKQNLIRKLI